MAKRQLGLAVFPDELVAGNANGDIPMLDFTRHDDKPFLRLLIKNDWLTVF